jgi:CDP-diacylglycerol---serine O-phosphatidyltransferase
MFNIPNFLTATNMLCGVMAIFLAFAGRIDIAPYFIFLGAILDFLDGFLARLLKQQGEMGKQLDSLADMITFGLAPGVIMMVVVVYGMSSAHLLDPASFGEYNTTEFSGPIPPWAGFKLLFSSWSDGVFLQGKGNWLPLAPLIIPFFSMFRLAKFNIDTRQSESFIGLPTPANTIFFMSFPLLLTRYAGVSGWQHDLILTLVQPAFLIPVIIVMSLLLVAELPLFALKFKSFSWKGNEIRYSFLAVSVILIPLLKFWSLPIIILLYLVLSVINNVRRRGQNEKI